MSTNVLKRIPFFISILTAFILSSHLLSAAEPFTLTARDGTNLSGIMEAPETLAPKAVALIFQGAGNVGASGEVSSPRIGQPYRGGRGDLSAQIAEALARNGIVSLRYAKRGFEDPSRLMQQTMDYIINDAADALALAKKKFPALPLIAIGFSEGALAALHAVQQTPVERLLLLGLPSRGIDEILAYQLLEWPIERVLSTFHVSKNLFIESKELRTAQKEGLPLLDPASVSSLGDSPLAIHSVLAGKYRENYRNFLELIEGIPHVRAWLKSIRGLPSVPTVAARTKIPVYLFHALDDSQIRPSATIADARFFPNLKKTFLYFELGHCFAPFDGTFGQIKSSGPIQDYVLNDIAAAALGSDIP